jgi:hypothetical protein
MLTPYKHRKTKAKTITAMTPALRTGMLLFLVWCSQLQIAESVDCTANKYYAGSGCFLCPGNTWSNANDIGCSPSPGYGFTKGIKFPPSSLTGPTTTIAGETFVASASSYGYDTPSMVYAFYENGGNNQNGYISINNGCWAASGAWTGTCTANTLVDGVSYPGDWVQLSTTGTPRFLGSYTITGTNFATWTIRKWIVAGSNDGSSWLKIDARSVNDWPAILQTLTVNVNPSVYRAFTYYRLIILENFGGPMATFGALELFFGDITACSAGAYTVPGTNACASTPPPGQYFSAQLNAFVWCPANSYCTGGAALPMLCPDGSVSPTGSSACNAPYPMFAAVADYGCSMRKVNLYSGEVTTLFMPIGSNSEECRITKGPTVNYFFMVFRDLIYQVALPGGERTHIAGSGVSGTTDGIGTAAQFLTIKTIATSPDGTFLLIGTSKDIRKMVISSKEVTTLTGSWGTYWEGTGTNIGLSNCGGMAISADNSFAIFISNDRVRKLMLQTKVSSFIAGNPLVNGQSDGVGSAARFQYPYDVSLSKDETIVYLLQYNTVKQVTLATANVVTLVTTDGGMSSSLYAAVTMFTTLQNIAYIGGTYAISTLDLSSGTFVTLAGMPGSPNIVNGVGSAARFARVTGISLITTCSAPGFAFSNGRCAPCAATSYLSDGICVPCPAYTSATPGSNTCIASTGYYMLFGSPVTCPTGFYCTGGSAQPKPCGECVGTEYAVTSCSPTSDVVCACNPGTFDTGYKCETCLPGYYCPVGATTRELCTEGFYCPDPSVQIACPSGRTCPAGRTKPVCPANNFCLNDQTDPQPCSACQGGSYAAAACTFDRDTVCLCPAGTYLLSGVCTACTGTCASGIGRCTAAGAMVCCNAGTFFVDSTSTACQTCASGTFSSTGNATTCTRCAGGLNSPNGSAACLASYPAYLLTMEKNLVLRKVDLSTKEVKTLSQPVLSATGERNMIAADSKMTKLFIASNDNKIYRMNPIDFSVSVFAGSGSAATTNGVGAAASFRFINDLAISPDGTYLLIATYDAIRRVSTVDATVTTITAISTAYQEGAGTSMQVNGVIAIDISNTGRFAVFFDSVYPRIRKLDLTVNPPVSSLIAGTGNSGSVNNVGNLASFRNVQDLVILPDETYVLALDTISLAIRKIDLSTNRVTNLYYSGQIHSPGYTGSIIFQSANLVLYDNAYQLNQLNIITGTAIQIAGTYNSPVRQDGVGALAGFGTPSGMIIPPGQCSVSGYGSTSVGSCAQCPSNTYAIAPGTCTPCPANSAAAPGSTACTPVPGYYESGGAVVACSTAGCNPPSTFAQCTSTGATVCCFTGTYWRNSLCTDCDAGQFGRGNDTTCFTCSAGTFSARASSACTACAAGTYSPAGSSACISASAASGQYFSTAANDFLACPAGSFCAGGSGQPQPCGTCSSGSYTLTACAATSNTVCQPCPAGSFCPNPANATVMPCTVCDGVNKYAASTCTSTTNTVCQSCTTCTSGKYVASSCTSTADKTCSVCPTGNFSTVSDALSSTPCSQCGAGTYASTACNSASNTVCTPCVAGTHYCPAGSTAPIACSTCSAGKYVTTACTFTSQAVCQGVFTLPNFRHTIS